MLLLRLLLPPPPPPPLLLLLLLLTCQLNLTVRSREESVRQPLMLQLKSPQMPLQLLMRGLVAMHTPARVRCCCSICRRWRRSQCVDWCWWGLTFKQRHDAFEQYELNLWWSDSTSREKKSIRWFGCGSGGVFDLIYFIFLSLYFIYLFIYLFIVLILCLWTQGNLSLVTK